MTETGRQPFVVYGLVRTAAAAAPVAAGAVSASLILFVLVYNLLLLTFLWFGARLVLKAPGLPDEGGPRSIRPGLDRAGPTVVGSAAANPAPARVRPAAGA